MPLSSAHRAAVYTGVFDPVHLGHLDLIQRGSRIFDRLVVGVGINPEKTPFFSQEECVELVQRVVKPYGNVEVMAVTGLAVRFVRQVGSRIVLRGLRTTSDMEYEFSMSLTNLTLDPEIETVFLMANELYSHISSSLIRQIAMFGNNADQDLAKFVPPEILPAIKKRVEERRKAQ